jgi:nucleotidyltransferase substrate binding protein (TIGR01987 family)
MEKKYINRFNSFKDSLQGLEELKTRDINDSFVISGAVQKFCLTFDISWKVMKDIIVNYHKINDFVTGSPRETLRQGYKVGLISDDRWMNMLNIRNELTHDYNGTLAAEEVLVIRDEYIPLFISFESKAAEYIRSMSDDNLVNGD